LAFVAGVLVDGAALDGGGVAPVGAGDPPGVDAIPGDWLPDALPGEDEAALPPDAPTAVLSPDVDEEALSPGDVWLFDEGDVSPEV